MQTEAMHIWFVLVIGKQCLFASAATEEAGRKKRRKAVEMLSGHMIKAPVWVRRGAQKVQGGGVR